jgi:hypothetical protein
MLKKSQVNAARNRALTYFEKAGIICANSGKGICRYTGDKLTCEIGYLKAGESTGVSITVLPSKEGRLVNRFSVTSEGDCITKTIETVVFDRNRYSAAQFRQLNNKLDQLVYRQNQQTTGPVVQSEDTKSTVFMLTNRSRKEARVKLTIYDLAEDTIRLEKEIILEENDTKAGIIARIPSVYMVTVNGMEEGISGFWAERREGMDYPIEKSSFIMQNTFRFS